MKKVIAALSMLGMMAVFSSCSSSKYAASLSDISGEWDIIEVDKTAVVPAPGEEFPYIGFDTQDGNVYGTGGCNRMMGKFDVDAKPGKLRLGTMGTTRMMCSDRSMEETILAALAKVKKYRKLDDGQIALCKSSKRPFIVLQKKADNK